MYGCIAEAGMKGFDPGYRPLDQEEPDLNLVLKSVVRDYFDGIPDVPDIVWSRGVIKARYRKLTLGSYHIKKNQIRIHPILKKKDHTGLLIRFVVYHELLHFQDREQLKKRKKHGKRVHNQPFKNREKAFPYYHEAAALMKGLLGA